MPVRGDDAVPATPVWTMVLLAGITVLGLALRLPSFGDSFWGDEVSTNFVVNGFGIGSIVDIVKTDQEGTPPLFFMLAWLTKGLGGPEGLRTVSLLAGLCAIPVTFALGRRTIGRDGALVAAALVALSPIQIFYSSEARAYELVLLLCLLAAVGLVYGIDTGRTRWWVLYGAAAAAAAYTHYTAVFLLAGIFVWALIAHPPARRPLLLATAAAAALYLPWVPELLDDRHEPAARAIGLLHPTTVSSVAEDVYRWAAGHPFFEPGVLPGRAGVALMAVGIAGGAVGLGVRALGRGPDSGDWPSRDRLALIAVLALALPVGAVLQGIIGTDVFSPRNIIASWPGVALAAGFVAAGGAAPWRYAAIALVVGGMAIGAARLLDEENRRPDYQGAVSFIEANGPPDSPVVEAFPLTPGPQTTLQANMAPDGDPAPPGRPMLSLAFPPLQSLLDLRRRGESVTEELPVPSGQEVAAEAAREAGGGTIFLVEGGGTLGGLYGDDDNPVEDFLDALPPRFREVDSAAFPGLSDLGLTVRVFRAEDGDGGRSP